ncbi:LytS/YehU family sensor histidine kinase [Lysobacter enzymogenes]|uniref:sensor histidine kinase n=1 Tax=Lysobacter enzymogenes TaxID=69 RepID=UPI00089A1336|nr:histidine kinase [Lysobacter enzymogenes]SDW69083.1 Histidine kinase [Lysobacter enzymogenes]
MLRDSTRSALIDAAFWAGYCAFNLSMSAAFGRVTSGAVVIAVALAAELWLAGRLMRRIAHRRHWFELGPLRLAVRLFACVVIGAALSQLLLVPPLWIAAKGNWIYLGPDNLAGFAWPMLLMYWAQTAMALALWTALWSWTVAMRRYREGEIARLNAESLRNASELDALRARLNPHFVFNALNNLRALINEDTERARELVTRLSSTLRHALDHSQREHVSVAEELAVVDDYLAVESVHYEDRLRVTREIDPAALELRLPPMALQLLVENAIKHGIARTPGGGELSLRVRGDGGRLRIEVGNPGRIEPESVRRGVGLAYLRTRLAHASPPGAFELRQHGARVSAQLEISQ